jgi:hypothetical protein
MVSSWGFLVSNQPETRIMDPGPGNLTTANLHVIEPPTRFPDGNLRYSFEVDHPSICSDAGEGLRP